MTATLRLILALAACTLVAVSASLLIATQAEQAVADNVHRVRNNYLLSTLRDTIESNLAIGLDINQMTGLQAMIEREKAGTDEIFAIDIYSPDSVLLYSTDQGARGSTLSGTWQTRLLQPEPWCTDTPDQRSCGIRVENDLGQPAAHLVITSPRNTSATTLRAWMARALPTLQLALLASLVAALTGGLIGFLMLGPFREAAAVLSGRLERSQASHHPLTQAVHDAQQAHTARRRQIEHDLLVLQELDDAS